MPEELVAVASRNPAVSTAFKFYLEGKFSLNETLSRLVQALVDREDKLSAQLVHMLSDNNPRSRYADESHPKRP